MVHLSVVTLISSNGEEHILHHCISLQHRDRAITLVLCDNDEIVVVYF